MTMIRRIAACLVTVSLLWGCLAGLTDLLERKSSDLNTNRFLRSGRILTSCFLEPAM